MPEPMSRTALRRRVLEDAGCERTVGLNHVIGRGHGLFDFVRALDDQGVVSMRDSKPAVLAGNDDNLAFDVVDHLIGNRASDDNRLVQVQDWGATCDPKPSAVTRPPDWMRWKA